MALKWFLIAALSFAFGFTGWVALSIWMMSQHPAVADVMNFAAAIMVTWLIFRLEDRLEKKPLLVGREQANPSQESHGGQNICESD